MPMQILQNLQSLYWKLRLAGHLAHQGASPMAEFAYGQDVLQQQAADLQVELDLWCNHIADIHTRYPLTCFLNTQQLVKASELASATIGANGEPAVTACL